VPGERERWNEKYRGAEGERRLSPEPFVQAALDRLGPGAARSALDLATGTGRHALELSRRGWRVLAVDLSPVALDILIQRALTQKLGVETRALDLEPAGSILRRERFELVVCVNYLDRELFAQLTRLIVLGGHLIYAAFTVDWAGEKPGPTYRLERGELARGLPGFETLLHEERDGRASLLARRVNTPVSS
jgi:SAM-dependent methyltransferase